MAIVTLPLFLQSGMAAALLLTCAVAPITATADRLFTQRSSDGVMTFSDVPLSSGSFERKQYSNAQWKASVANPCKGLTNAGLDAKGRTLDPQFIKAGQRHSVDPSLLKAVARAESCFDPLAVSAAGAKGLMQLMPATAQEVGVSLVFDAEQNLMGGAKYLAAMLKRYSTDTHMALAAYNAGPGTVDRYGGIPPYPETQRYIKKVDQYRRRYAPGFPKQFSAAASR